MSEHTKGPWHVIGYSFSEDRSSPTGRRARLQSANAEFHAIHAANCQVADKIKAEKDARRIVRCVNALDGISNPEQAIPALINALDGLLVEWGNARDMRIAEENARAALALVRGKGNV